MVKKILIVCLFSLGLVTSCKKDSTNPAGVPNVLVSFGPVDVAVVDILLY